VISGGWPQLLHRSVQFQSSPVYYFLPWLAIKLAGVSEVAIRLPSLFAMLAATFVVWRLGKFLFDAETGVIAALLFVSLKQIALASVGARPYAVALLAVIGAMFFLIRWLNHRDVGNAIGYIILASLTVYLHILFSLMFLVHLFWIFLFTRAGGWVRIKHLLWLYAGVILLLVPFFPQFVSLIARRNILSFAPNPSLWSAVETPAKILVAVALYMLIMRLAYRKYSIRRLDIEPRVRVFWGLFIWAFLPPLLLYLITLFSPYHLYVEHYFLCAEPGLVLFLAGVLRSLRPVAVMRIIVMALAVIWIISTFHSRSVENWRAAIQVAREFARTSSSPVLIQSGLIESDQADWLRDPEKKSYLLAPISFYPVNAQAVPLPSHVNPATKTYLDELAQQQHPSLDHFLVIQNNPPLHDPLKDELQSFGFKFLTVGQFGSIALFIFER
jgi:4-amino-4-deoxy-L-arabinose transferase-like glycosyltransferase